jgi:integrase/recombinase XerD
MPARPFLFPHVSSAYVAQSGNIKTPASRKSYRKVIRLLQHTYPGKHMDEFTVDDLTTFCLSRFDGKPGFAADTTQKNRRAHIRSTWEWAYWKGYVKTNPALDLKFTVKPGNGQVRTGTWLSKAEVVALARGLDTPDVQDQRDRMVFLVGVLTGLRCFELAGLTWSQFKDDLTELKLKGKGDKIVTLGVPDELRDALAVWRKRRQMGGVAVFPSFKWVYDPGQMKRRRMINWDTPLGEAGIGDVVNKIGEACGIRVTPHDMRRTFAGMLEEAGVGLKDVQLAMRHEGIGTTDKYLAKNPARTVGVVKGFRLGL